MRWPLDRHGNGGLRLWDVDVGEVWWRQCWVQVIERGGFSLLVNIEEKDR